jgi:phytoene dehydrogenase-like protein
MLPGFTITSPSSSTISHRAEQPSACCLSGALHFGGLRSMARRSRFVTHHICARRWACSPPMSAPAHTWLGNPNVIAHVELSRGVVPQGGVYRIAEAWGCDELGVEVRTACRVQAIDVRQGIPGVILASVRSYRLVVITSLT